MPEHWSFVRRLPSLTSYRGTWLPQSNIWNSSFRQYLVWWIFTGRVVGHKQPSYFSHRTFAELALALETRFGHDFQKRGFLCTEFILSYIVILSCGQNLYCESTVLLRSATSERCESWHEEMKPGKGHHVHGQLSQIGIQLARKSKASCNTGHCCRNQMIEIAISRSCQLQSPYCHKYIWQWNNNGTWNKCRTRLRYRYNRFHRCFQLADELRVLHCTAQLRYQRLSVMGQRKKCSLFCRGILREFWRWVKYPYQNQFHLQANVSIEILEDNHNFQLLFRGISLSFVTGTRPGVDIIYM